MKSCPKPSCALSAYQETTYDPCSDRVSNGFVVILLFWAISFDKHVFMYIYMIIRQVKTEMQEQYAKKSRRI